MSFAGNHSETMRIPTTNPAPTIPRASRLITSIVNELDMANIVFGTTENTSSAEKSRRGPNRSSSAPTTIRAGTVSARLHNVSVTICAFVRPSSARMATANGAMSNHTTKLRKNAIVVRWSTRLGPRKDHRGARRARRDREDMRRSSVVGVSRRFPFR
jgi:hypothetical protein